jgi:hypothetical protein
MSLKAPNLDDYDVGPCSIDLDWDLFQLEETAARDSAESDSGASSGHASGDSPIHYYPRGLLFDYCTDSDTDREEQEFELVEGVPPRKKARRRSGTAGDPTSEAPVTIKMDQNTPYKVGFGRPGSP